jgi:hypothetical protein
MKTNTQTFQHQVIRTHNFMSKRTIMKKFAFDDYVKAMALAQELNDKDAETSMRYHVETVKAK